MFAAIDDSVTLPGYTRADAALFLSLTDRTRVQMNVENVFNRIYYVNADSNTNISPGSPRVVRSRLESDVLDRPLAAATLWYSGPPSRPLVLRAVNHAYRDVLSDCCCADVAHLARTRERAAPDRQDVRRRTL